MKINDNVMRAAMLSIKNHFLAHRNEMEDVYCSCDEPLAVTLKLKFSEDKNGVRVETEISFIKERVKEKCAVVVDERQLKFDGIDKITASVSGGQEQTIYEKA